MKLAESEAESNHRQPGHEVVVEETSMAASAQGLHRHYFSSANYRETKCSLDFDDKQGEVELGRWHLRDGPANTASHCLSYIHLYTSKKASKLYIAWYLA
ncbi:hypothetical protein QL285_040585 [Trifolium repens]|nr:hypothetical protein QL285_040585 [Trifolium repens]